MYLKELSEAEFGRFVDFYNTSSIYQTVPYAKTMEKQGFEYKLLGMIDENRIVAASLIFIKKIGNFKHAYAPRGLLVDYKDLDLLKTFTTEIKRYLGKRSVVNLKISPIIVKSIMNSKGDVIGINPDGDMILENLKSCEYTHLGYTNYFEGLKPRFNAVLSMKDGYVNTFNRIRKEFRSKIRNAEKYGIRVYKGNQDDLNYLNFQTEKKYPRGLNYFQSSYYYFGKENKIDFYYAKLDSKAYLETVQKTYFETETEWNRINDEVINIRTKNSKRLLNQKINMDKVMNVQKNRLIEATNILRDNPDGIVLASVLVVRQKDSVTILMDGFDPKYRYLNAKHLILWKIIEKYSNAGYRYLRLGGVTNIKIKDNKYKGLNDFKLNFGADVFEYFGDFEVVTNPTLYFMYNKFSKEKK